MKSCLDTMMLVRHGAAAAGPSRRPAGTSSEKKIELEANGRESKIDHERSRQLTE
jgi:hypothetical protein